MINETGKQHRMYMSWRDRLTWFVPGCREWLRAQGFRWRRG